MTWAIKAGKFFQCLLGKGGPTVGAPRGSALRSLPAVAPEGTPPGHLLPLSKLHSRGGHRAELAGQPLRGLDEIPFTGSNLLVQAA